MKPVVPIVLLALGLAALAVEGATAQTTPSQAWASYATDRAQPDFGVPSPRDPARVATRSSPNTLPPPPPGATGSSADFQLPPGTSGPFRAESLQSSGPSRPSFTPQTRGVSPAVPGQSPAPGTSGKILEAAKVIARVGDQVVLAGDVLGQVNQFVHNYLQSLPAEHREQIPPEALEAQRWKLVAQLLPQTIDTKLVYLDFLRSVPEERLPDIQDGIYQQFDEKQLPLMIERAKVQTAADLDRLLRSFGSSLDQQRRSFAEQLVAAQWKRQHGTSKKEVSHADMLGYYFEHRAEFEIKAKAKWEQLTALHVEFSSKQESRGAIERMGNEVLRGAPFDAVARRSSQGPTATDGGGYGWTTKGSLRSSVLEAAIFTLPIGRLSEILEDDDGWHIIRVTERQEEGVVSFADAQATIREKINQQRAEQALQEYIQKLRAEMPVWTIFDDAPAISP